MEIAILTSCVSAAIEKIRSDLRTQSPCLAEQVWDWMQKVSRDGDPVGHLTQLAMFPMLQMPEWLMGALRIEVDEEFRQSLIDSTVHGYYYTRLIDDVMDGDRKHKLELSILPAAGLFCSQFQYPYQRYFPSEHPFWRNFQQLWMAACGSAALDYDLRTVSRSEFEQISARKFSAAGIPLTAVCYYCRRRDLIGPWLEFADEFSRWSQMLDDACDWHSDRRDGRATFFLSEAANRRQDGESIERWVAREGNDWVFGLLQQGIRVLRGKAEELGSLDLLNYLDRRKNWLLEQSCILRKGFDTISQLAEILREAQAHSEASSGEEHELPKNDLSMTYKLD